MDCTLDRLKFRGVALPPPVLTLDRSVRELFAVVDAIPINSGSDTAAVPAAPPPNAAAAAAEAIEFLKTGSSTGATFSKLRAWLGPHISWPLLFMLLLLLLITELVKVLERRFEKLVVDMLGCCCILVTLEATATLLLLLFVEARVLLTLLRDKLRRLPAKKAAAGLGLPPEPPPLFRSSPW